MRVHVAFTPGEAADAPVGIVVDVLRATSTIAQALASGYERVYCCREVEEARALRDTLGEGLLGGERDAVRIEGFDVGASPREFLGEPRATTVIFSTTNGTRAILETAYRTDEVLLGSLLNLDAVARAARERGEDVMIVCAGPDAHEGLLARTYGPPGLEDDIAFCAQVGMLEVMPRLSRMVDGAAEITKGDT
jgi:2-phosphosulfolactate phosphatase